MATTTKTPRSRSAAPTVPSDDAAVEAAEAVVDDADVPVIELMRRQQEAQAAKAAAEGPKKPDVLVDLDEGADERPTVRHEGRIYELAIMDDFSLRKQRKLARWGKEFHTLYDADAELTDEQDDRLDELLETMFAKVFRGPVKVKKDMKPGRKAQCVLGFTLAPLVQKMRKLQAEQARLEELQALQAPAGTQPVEEPSEDE